MAACARAVTWHSCPSLVKERHHASLLFVAALPQWLAWAQRERLSKGRQKALPQINGEEAPVVGKRTCKRRRKQHTLAFSSGAGGASLSSALSSNDNDNDKQNSTTITGRTVTVGWGKKRKLAFWHAAATHALKSMKSSFAQKRW